MPIYEYACYDCKITFEEQMGIKEDSKLCECPKCKEKVKKIPSVTTFHLKGGGWAADRYVSKMDKFEEHLKCVD